MTHSRPTSGGRAAPSPDGGPRTPSLLLFDFAGHAFTLDLAEAIAETGRPVTYAYCATNLAPHGDFEGVSVPIDAVGSGARFEKYRLLPRLVSELRFGVGGASIVWRRRPEIVVAANWPILSLLPLWLAVRWRRAQLVIWLQDVQSGLLQGSRGASALVSIVAAAEGFVLRRADRVVAISRPIAAAARGAGVPDRKVRVLENWAPVERMPRQSKDNEWRRSMGFGDRPIVMYAGTLGRKHSPAQLLALADDLPDMDVVIVSEGEGADWIAEQLAASPRPNVRVLPFQRFEDVPAMLASADVLVALLNPGADGYSVPSKVLGYLCAARPIVAGMPPSNLAAELISLRARAGLVVAPGDRRELASAVSAVLEDPDLASEFGEAGRRYAETSFARRRVAEQFLEAASATAEPR